MSELRFSIFHSDSQSDISNWSVCCTSRILVVKEIAYSRTDRTKTISRIELLLCCKCGYELDQQTLKPTGKYAQMKLQ